MAGVCREVYEIGIQPRLREKRRKKEKDHGYIVIQHNCRVVQLCCAVVLCSCNDHLFLVGTFISFSIFYFALSDL